MKLLRFLKNQIGETGIPIAAFIGIMIAMVVGVNLIGPMTESINEAIEPTPATTSILPDIIQQPVSIYSDLGIPKEFGGPTWALWILLILIIIIIAAWIIGKKKKFKILEGNE